MLRAFVTMDGFAVPWWLILDLFLDLLDEDARQNLGSEKGRFFGHDQRRVAQTGVGDSHQLGDRDRVEGYGDVVLACIDALFHLIEVGFGVIIEIAAVGCHGVGQAQLRIELPLQDTAIQPAHHIFGYAGGFQRVGAAA